MIQQLQNDPVAKFVLMGAVMEGRYNKAQLRLKALGFQIGSTKYLVNFNPSDMRKNDSAVVTMVVKENLYALQPTESTYTLTVKEIYELCSNAPAPQSQEKPSKKANGSAKPVKEKSLEATASGSPQ